MAAMKADNWRLIINALTPRDPKDWRYALDNGAWSAFTQAQPFDVPAFERALAKYAPAADWTVLPDIVAGGHASLETSLWWMRRVLDAGPRALLAVQDGMAIDDVETFVGPRVGLFIGGSTAWKWETLPAWAELARRASCWLHVGRVNTSRRIHACSDVGATSFDGTSPSRFSITTPKLSHARDQLNLFHGGNKQ